MDERAQDSGNVAGVAPGGVTRRELLTAMIRGRQSAAPTAPGIYATAAAVAASAALGEISPTADRQMPPPDLRVPRCTDPTVSLQPGTTAAHAAQMLSVRGLHDSVAQAAHAVFGNRLGAVLIDDQGRLVVTITGLTEADTRHVRALAAYFGIEDWVQAERAARAG